MAHTFLLELGLEEMPSDVISPALEQFSTNLEKLLSKETVVPTSICTYSTPRRLAILVDGLPEYQPGREELVLGPATAIALDQNGRPGKAALGFARSQGLEVDQLERMDTKKGEYLGYCKKVEGRFLPEILKENIPQLIASLSWPRSRFKFIRPLRWCVSLWDQEVVSFRFEGIESGRISRGHRFLGSGDILLKHALDYPNQLRKNFVLASVGERYDKISKELLQQVPRGLIVVEDDNLLDTVVHLNEYPSVLWGALDKEFLKIPQEVLVTVMRHHQKYFSVTDKEGRLQPYFLTVVNTNEDPEGRIQKGHESVLRARLKDAAFFWETDMKTGMKERSQKLGRVVFHEQLGTYLEKVQRLKVFCSWLAPSSQLETAALLSKADLTSEMVREFPELQGVMGGLYARQEGYSEQIWKSILEHYKPVSLNDALPSTRSGALLALADKLDTVTACFAGGIVPTGSSDPFSLRRQGLSIVKILLDFHLAYPLQDLVEMAQKNIVSKASGQDLSRQILSFLEQRVRYVFQVKGLSDDVIQAVQAVGFQQSVYHQYQKVRALSEIRGNADFEALAAAYKRIKNILADQTIELDQIRTEDLEEPAEKTLNQAVLETGLQVKSRLEKGQYLNALKQMSCLRSPVDQFFDEVLVMSEQENIRRNRLRILHEISQLFLSFADISMVSKEQ